MTFALATKPKSATSRAMACSKKPLLNQQLGIDAPNISSINHGSHSAPLIQARLKVGEPNDKYEQEADQVADRVMRMPAPQAVNKPDNFQSGVGHRIQRVCTGCEDELQRKPINENTDVIQRKETLGNALTVTPKAESQINGLKGGGQPLPKSVRNFFEPRFGHDFSNVRIRTDNESSRSASALNAQAYTYGNSIVFGADQYNPNSTRGRMLLAHELTHFVQQQGGLLTSSELIQRQVGAERRARASIERGDSYYDRIYQIFAVNHEEYGVFRNSVIRELRHYIVFERGERDRNFIREMIDLLGQLRTIHSNIRSSSSVWNNERLIPISAVLRRRDDPIPSMRWVVGMAFSLPEPLMMEGEEVSPDPDEYERIVREREKRQRDRLRPLLRRLQAGDEEGYRCLFDVAENIGGNMASELYYLSPIMVQNFLDASHDDQRRMLAGGIPPLTWKRYVFREFGLNERRSDAENVDILRRTAQIIRRTLVAFHSRNNAMTQNANSPEFFRLYNWLREQQTTRGNAYNCFTASDD